MGKHAPTTRRLGCYLNWKIRITGTDGRTLTGTLVGFDKHVNIILLDAEEQRTIKSKKAGKPTDHTRTVGFVVVRGDTVLSVECIDKPKKKGKEDAKVPKIPMPMLMGKGMPMMAGL
eukprot:gene387-680_t